jgi:hypothetical protein
MPLAGLRVEIEQDPRILYIVRIRDGDDNDKANQEP